ncbi:MAG TPA: hypothetical protein V6D26_06245, partial [Stenomitos sp.]
AARRINEQLRRRGQDEGVQALASYQQLVKTTKASVKQATTIKGVLEKLSTPQVQRLVQILSQFIPRIEQVITQTCRSVANQREKHILSSLVEHPLWLVLTGGFTLNRMKQ